MPKLKMLVISLRSSLIMCTSPCARLFISAWQPSVLLAEAKTIFWLALGLFCTLPRAAQPLRTASASITDERPKLGWYCVLTLRLASDIERIAGFTQASMTSLAFICDFVIPIHCEPVGAFVLFDCVGPTAAAGAVGGGPHWNSTSDMSGADDEAPSRVIE
jgi:hypothetical protein